MILAFELLILTGCESGPKEVKLAYKFPTDKKFHYKYDGEINSTIYENGKLVDSGEKPQKISYTMETAAITDDGNGRLHYVYSTEPSGANEIAPASAVSDSGVWSTDFVMDPRGRIIDIIAGDETSAETIDYYKKLFEQTSPMYPEEPVSVGYNWNHTVKAVLNTGTTDASTTYKIKALVREAGYDCAVIEYKGTMFIPLADNLSKDPDITASGHDRIDVEGVVYFAYTLGTIVREEETSHVVREGILTRGKQEINFKIDEIRNFTSRLVEIENL